MTEKETSEVAPETAADGVFAEHEQDPQTSATVIGGQESPEAAEAASPVVEEIDWKTRAAYLTAEIENMQKRFFREASEIRKYGNEDFLRSVTPVLDNLTLALQAAEKAKQLPEHEAIFSNKIFLSFIQGVEMTAKQFEQTLSTLGVEFIKAVGEKFDPALHEALGQTTRAGAADGVVVEEFQRGFKVGGRVIRPAKVIVNKV